MKKQIEIRLFPDGRIQTLTRNVKGKECFKFIEPLEKLLEAKVVDSEFTSEYYEEEIYVESNSRLSLNF